MLIRGILKSKIALKLVVSGLGCSVAGGMLAVAAFGITFGTACFMAGGLFVAIYGATFAKTVDTKLNAKLRLSNRVLSWLLLTGLISFIWIETLVFQSLQSAGNVSSDYAIVLGAGIRGEEPSITLRRRLDRSIEYLAANPNARVIVSGGYGKDTAITEAEVMKRYLIAHGISELRILKEEKSTTSDENLKYTRQLLDQLYGREVTAIAVITSDYHMFRAKHIASRYYSEVYGIPSETPAAIRINYAIREYFAVLKMVVVEMGKKCSL